ncbi:hypothetical protein E2K60_26680, partial [Escherichia coli]
FTETEAGVYQSVFTTGTQSGEATITVSVDGMSKTVTAELRASIARNLIDQHSGKIEFTSWPGHTEFSVYLPIRK